MSVIFKADGIEAVFTFLIAGSAASAVRASTPPASIANEDLSTLRRLTAVLLSSDIFTFPLRIFVISSYSRTRGCQTLRSCACRYQQTERIALWKNPRP